MKKFLLTFVLILIGFLGGYSQVVLETSAYINNHWTGWDNQGYLAGSYYRGNFSARMLYDSRTNTFYGLKFWSDYDSPHEWCFQFYMDNYVKPDNRTRREHDKNKIWYEYSGYVEYYVSDEYPTIEKVLQHFYFPMVRPHGDTVRVKRTARATIKIAPYKKEPTCFNIYFDGVGVGISFSKWPFEKSYIK